MCFFYLVCLAQPDTPSSIHLAPPAILCSHARLRTHASCCGRLGNSTKSNHLHTTQRKQIRQIFHIRSHQSQNRHANLQKRRLADRNSTCAHGSGHADGSWLRAIDCATCHCTSAPAIIVCYVSLVCRGLFSARQQETENTYLTVPARRDDTQIAGKEE